MKIFILRILLFGLLCLVLYFPLAGLVGNYCPNSNISYLQGNYGHQGLRIMDIANHADVDVLFLGSSHAYRTFDTRFFQSKGIKCFNLGSSNQTPLQTLSLLRDWLGVLNPQLVVFEVHPDVFALRGSESGVDLVSNAPVSLNSYSMALRTRSLKVVNTATYGLTKLLTDKESRKFLEDSVISVGVGYGKNGQVMADFSYVNGGFVEVSPLFFDGEEKADYRKEINPVQKRAMKQCMRLLHRNGVSVVLVESPSSEIYFSHQVNHDEFVSFVEQLPYKQDFLNYNDNKLIRGILHDTVHFSDEDHLNQQGVLIFDSLLWTDLLRKGYLK